MYCYAVRLWEIYTNLTNPLHLITGIENNRRQDDIKEYLRIERSLQKQNMQFNSLSFVVTEMITIQRSFTNLKNAEPKQASK